MPAIQDWQLKAHQILQNEDKEQLQELIDALNHPENPLVTIMGLLEQVFLHLFAKGTHRWLKTKQKLFLEGCLSLVAHTDKRISVKAFEKYLCMCKLSSEMTNEFQNQMYIPLIECILQQPPTLLLPVVAQALNKYADLMYYFYKAVAVIKNVHLDTTFDLLMACDPTNLHSTTMFCEGDMTGDGTKTNSMSHPKALKKAFSQAWFKFLGLNLKPKMYIQILECLDAKIIPHLSEPCHLMDFLVSAYDTGGLVSLLALNSLFTLVNQHNLDYPDFYTKLYQLFDHELLHSKYVSRFFRLVELFLSSTHLPSYMVASFIKRMCRLCLTAPPNAIIIVLPLIFNLFKRHPSCLVLIHRESTGEYNDPFDMSEKDPSKTKALDSCLWEIVMLKSHYLYTISSLASMFEASLAKPLLKMEDFYDHSYQMMMDTEIYSKYTRNMTAETLPLAYTSLGKDFYSGWE